MDDSDTINPREHLLKHSLAILDAADSWDLGKRTVTRIQQSGEQSRKTFEKAVVPFLCHLIKESCLLGGTVLEIFWEELGECGIRLKNNLQVLQRVPFQNRDDSVRILSGGIEEGLENIDYTRVIDMAADYLTHLGVPIFNPGVRKSGKASSNSVTEQVALGTDELLAGLDSIDRSWKSRKQKVLKALAIRRDGDHCPITSLPFKDKIPGGVSARLSHVIPNAIQDNNEILNHIAIFAGESTRDKVVQNLNRIGNFMNLEPSTCDYYDQLEWAIEAREDGRVTRYLFRRIPSSAAKIVLIPLNDGEEIKFGRGSLDDRQKLGNGPLPVLCNLKLAVTRLMKMSGVADILTQYQEDADDTELSHVYISSEDWLEVVDAKLVLSGRALLV